MPRRRGTGRSAARGGNSGKLKKKSKLFTFFLSYLYLESFLHLQQKGTLILLKVYLAFYILYLGFFLRLSGSVMTLQN